MPISDDRYSFTAENLDKAPNEAGVYALYDGDSLIYIGRAQGGSVTIRSRLKDHKAGRDGPCTKAATSYKREVTSQSVSREKELLDEYYNTNRRLPKCNDVRP